MASHSESPIPDSELRSPDSEVRSRLAIFPMNFVANFVANFVDRKFRVPIHAVSSEGRLPLNRSRNAEFPVGKCRLENRRYRLMGRIAKRLRTSDFGFVSAFGFRLSTFLKAL